MRPSETIASASTVEAAVGVDRHDGDQAEARVARRTRDRAASDERAGRDGLAVPAHSEPEEPAPGTRRSHDGAVAPVACSWFPPVASGETNGRSIPSRDERTTRARPGRRAAPSGNRPRARACATRSRAGSRASTSVTVVATDAGHGAVGPMRAPGIATGELRERTSTALLWATARSTSLARAAACRAARDRAAGRRSR